MRVTVDKTASLLFPVFRGWLGGFGGFKEFFQGIGHGSNIVESG
jgi:hypothetical protein